MSAQHYQRAEVRALIAAARRAGWTVEDCSNGHVKFLPPQRELGMVVAAKTPSEHHSIANTVSQLRRCGLVVQRGKTSR